MAATPMKLLRVVTSQDGHIQDHYVAEGWDDLAWVPADAWRLLGTTIGGRFHPARRGR